MCVGVWMRGFSLTAKENGGGAITTDNADKLMLSKAKTDINNHSYHVFSAVTLT